MDDRLEGAIKAGDRARVEALLRDEPGLARERNGDLSAVMLAAYHRQRDIAKVLADARGPADLFEAAALGLEGRVRELVGWDPRAIAARSADGFTPLHLAAYFGHAAIVRFLLDADAWVGAVAENPSRVHPLHSGVAGGNLEVVEALLAAHADVEGRQEGGFTPLMGAAAGGSVEIVGALIAVGADKAATNDEGKTALDIARERGHADVEALLA